MKRRVRLGSYAVLAVALTLFTTRAVSSPASPTLATEATAKETSVVWIVLDEAPLYALLRSDGAINATRFPGFARLASMSTWYRDTLATAQRTTEAVPAMLESITPTIRNYPVLADHPVNLFTLTEGHKALDVYQSITSLCPAGLCPNKIPDSNRPAEFQIEEFRALTRRVATSTEATVHFSHLLLPHRPWRFSTDMRLSRELPVDPRPSTIVDRRRDSYQALLRQFVATDTLLNEFLDALENSPNRDRTMLVVTSDHGMTFVPGESFRDEVNPARRETLEDIYRVPLFIKYPGQTTPQVSDCTASSLDILPTVLSVADIPHNEKFDGVDLSSQCPRRQSRRVQWPYSGTDLTTDFSAIVSRVQYYDTWVDADGDVDDIHRVERSGQLIGTQTPASAPVRPDISWTNIDPGAFTNIEDERFGYVPTRVSGRVTTTSSICASCEGVLVIDGIVVASIPELQGVTKGIKPAYFTTSVDPRTLTSQSGVAELWIADWTSGTPVLQRVGPALDR
jgi:hypothetical protein